MTAFGSTNAPVEISGTWGVEGDDGRDVRTTLAKWVGTATFGGLPITSYDFNMCVCVETADQQTKVTTPGKTSDGSTHDSPFPICLLAREIQRDSEHINIGERIRQLATPIF